VKPNKEVINLKRWSYELTEKRGQSRVNVSYSPPSPQTLIPYNLQKGVIIKDRVK